MFATSTYKFRLDAININGTVSRTDECHGPAARRVVFLILIIIYLIIINYYFIIKNNYLFIVHQLIFIFLLNILHTRSKIDYIIRQLKINYPNKIKGYHSYNNETCILYNIRDYSSDVTSTLELNETEN